MSFLEIWEMHQKSSGAKELKRKKGKAISLG
jgi:hypothetical protein